MSSVAVIIPTYNRWPFICTAIDSVLAQTHPDTRCIVVDDASGDDSVRLLQEKYGDAIAILTNSDNRGQSFCRNLGATTSDADYVCFLDSDDSFTPDSIASRLSLIEESRGNIKVSFGLFRKSGRNPSPLKGIKPRGSRLTLAEYLADKNWLCNNSFLIERATFIADGLYNPQLRNREDIELLIRLLAKHNFHFCGEEIGQIRDVCSNRARNNFTNILNPENSFAHFIESNPHLREKLPPHTLKSLLDSEVELQLRTLYRMGRYPEFRTLYQEATARGQVSNRRKFRKRYLLSFARGLLRQNLLVRDVRREIQTSGDYVGQRRLGERIFYHRKLKNFCEREDSITAALNALIEAGHLYKSDQTSSVASVDVDGTGWVIKRYNNKGLVSTLKLVLRPSRAQRAFYKALILRNLEVQTPAPLMYVVTYKHGLPYCSYIINERSKGDTICNLADSNRIGRDEWPAVVAKTGNILDKLHLRGITHGDIKPTNILLDNGEIELIDLDSMRIHWSKKMFRHFRDKDLNALNSRVAGYFGQNR
ncbi:MAG: glycosyltransferase [Porticoccaceae bacterium]